MSEGTPGTEGGLKRRLGVIQTSALVFAGVGDTGPPGPRSSGDIRSSRS
jgi:hypothetical protein